MAQQYHSQLIARINAQTTLNLNTIKLEAIIGVPLSNVLTNSTPSEKGQKNNDIDTER